MVAWRFAIRVHALVLDHEVDDFSAGPLLLIPYAVSDSSTAFTTLVLDDLLKELETSKQSL